MRSSVSPKYSVRLLLSVVLLMFTCATMSGRESSSAGDASASSSQYINNPLPSTFVAQNDSLFKNLSAQAWVLVDGRSGKVLLSKNENRTLYPASMTKMMTCILAIESGRLSDTIEISRTAAATPTTCKVRQGEQFILRDLLDAMMLDSDNGAATAVAEFLSTPDRPFSSQMNAKARQLGMKNTNFVNPHGLPDDYHYSTASDMMLLERYCMSNEIFAQIVCQPDKDVPMVKPANRVRHCKNTNKLLTTYPGAIGCKTGYTRKAGGCLASCAIRDDIQVFLVVMNCNPPRERMPESAMLLDRGFELAKQVRLEERRTQTGRPPVPPRAKKPHQSQKPVPERRKKK